MKFLSIVFAALLLTTAPASALPLAPALMAGYEVEKFTVVSPVGHNAKKDVLIVLDNSGSMQSHVDGVKKAILNLAENLEQSRVDARIGFLSGDERWNDPAGLNGMFKPNLATQLVGGTAVDLTKPDWRSELDSKFVGSNGPAQEQLSYPLYSFLHPQRLASGGQLGGLGRTDADLVLMFITDSDEERGIVEAGALRQLLMYHYDLSKMKTYSFLCISNTECDSEWDTTDIEKNALVKLSRGFSAELLDVTQAETEMTTVVNQLGLGSGAPVVDLALAGKPVDASLRVFVGGVEWHRGTNANGTGFNYDAALNKVIFDSQIKPFPGTEVLVLYEAQSTQPTDPADSGGGETPGEDPNDEN